MRHRISSRTFGRRSGPRKALLRGLASNLIDAERITTTLAKAKELRKFVEPLVTLAKRGDLHARRMISGEVYKKETVQKLFNVLAIRFKDRPGGYTRILRTVRRQGDGAELAMIEFLDRSAKGESVASHGKNKKKQAAKKPEAKKETKASDKKEKPKTEKKSAAAKTAKKPTVK